MQKHMLCAAAAALLASCGEEPEVAEIETPDHAELAASDRAQQSWDQNGDGLIQRVEYLRFGEANFTEWEIDRSGSLSPKEFEVGWDMSGFDKANDVFNLFDDDSDGELSREEFFGIDEWNEWDTDNNGVLDQVEFAYY